jgi:hypothetical protein
VVVDLLRGLSQPTRHVRAGRGGGELAQDLGPAGPQQRLGLVQALLVADFVNDRRALPGGGVAARAAKGLVAGGPDGPRG